MNQQLAQAAQSSTMEIIAKLEVKRDSIARQIQSIEEPTTATRCEALRAFFEELYASVRENVVRLEQDKGIAKGIALSAGIIGSHADIWKSELADVENAEKLKFALDVVSRAVRSLSEAAIAKRSELERNAGRFDGVVNSAMATLDRVDKIVENVKRAAQKEAEIDSASNANDEVDQALEQQAEKRRIKMAEKGGNGSADDAYPGTNPANGDIKFPFGKRRRVAPRGKKRAVKR